MDPVTGAVVAIVIFTVSIPVAFWVGVFLFAALGAMISEGAGVFGLFLGWALAGAYSVFALIQAILQVIRLVQLLTGAAT